jgi:ComF family protein
MRSSFLSFPSFPSFLSFLDLVLPPICLACDGLIGSGDTRRLVCRRCRSQLRRPSPPVCVRCSAPLLRTGRPAPDVGCEECCAWPAELKHAWSAYLMHPPADRIVHQLKYRGWSALGAVMGEAMAESFRASPVVSNVDVVMPVPTTASRLRERGYNQAELIAQNVAKRLGLECVQILERTSGKSTQTTLQPAARGANVAGAFRVRPDACNRVREAHILIVDDVLTTGATAIECTRTLIEAGARCTSVLAYARAVDSRLMAT